MKKFFTIFFVTLGVIFSIIILLVGYLFIAGSPDLRPDILGSDSTEQVLNEGEVIDKHPILTPLQEQTLETIGIDPADVPAEITPAMEACFVEKLGSKRVEEIKAGDSPTAIEIFTAKGCL